MRAAILMAMAMTMTMAGCFGGDDDACVDAVQPVDRAPGTEVAGIERCGRAWNSTAAVACTLDEASRCAHTELGSDDTCLTDADCAGTRCIDGGEGCGCVDVCRTDADCAADEACVCGAFAGEDGGFSAVSSVPRCIPATCRDADDCDGRACGVEQEICGGASALTCRAAFECADGSDCPFGLSCVEKEAPGTGWECRDNGLTCD